MKYLFFTFFYQISTETETETNTHNFLNLSNLSNNNTLKKNNVLDNPKTPKPREIIDLGFRFF